MSDIGLRWELPKDVSPTLVPSQPPVCIHVGSRICLYAMLTGQHLQVGRYVYTPFLQDILLTVALKLVFTLVVNPIIWFWHCANYCSADYQGQMQDFWKWG